MDQWNSLTISIEGECSFERTGNSYSTLRFERPVNFAGTGEDATLKIHASGRNAIFSDLSNIAFYNARQKDGALCIKRPVSHFIAIDSITI